MPDPTGPARARGDAATRILFVCHANVCRSALAAYRFAHGLGAVGAAGRIDAVSAGTHEAMAGAPICTRVARSIDEHADGARFAAAHAATVLRPDLIESAALVLTMTVDQRGAVARLVPGCQQRVFTLMEAAALTEACDDDSREDDLHAVAARLHAARWRVPRTVGGTRIAGRPLDVVDGHSLGPRAHRRTIATVAAAADELGRFAGRMTARDLAL